MKSSVICSVAVAAAFVVWMSPVALALDKTPVLSLDLAKKIAAGCEAKAKEMSWKMNISVVDSGAKNGTMALEEGLTAAALYHLLLRAIAGQRQLQFRLVDTG